MREASFERKTLETQINVRVNLDGKGERNINTGIKFFNHMLEQFAAHGHFDIELSVNSLDGDPHHVVEDVALALGTVFKQALGAKKGINRYSDITLPMDESLALVAVDLSGRACCVYDVDIQQEKVSDFETILFKHFFKSFSDTVLMALHIKLIHGEDSHHKIEAVFKAFARAMRKAVAIDYEFMNETPSTKGVL